VFTKIVFIISVLNGLDRSGLLHRQLAGFCQHSSEPLGSIKYVGFLH